MRTLSVIRNDVSTSGTVSVFFVYVVIALCAFATTFAADWAMDDYIVLVKNPDIQSLSQFFKDSYPGRPLRELTYMLDYKLFGLVPTGYHVQNVFWHVTSGFLLYVALVTMGVARLPAFIGGALFLVHPVTVEVVANISHRKDSLMLTFSLAAFVLTLKFAGNIRRRWWLGGLAILLWGVSCYAKQPAIVLPLVLLFAWLIPMERVRQFFSHHYLREMGLWWLLLVGLSGWLIYLQGNSIFQELIGTGMVYLGFYEPVTPGIFFAAVAKATAFMWLRLLWPSNLAFQYQFEPPSGFFDPWVLGCLAGLGLLVYLFRYGCKKNHLLAVGVTWFILFQLPTSNLLWPLAYFAADRYQYAPLAGLVMMLVALLPASATVKTPRLVFGVGVGVVVLLGLLSWQQSLTWNSELSLYRQAVKISPNSSSALVGLSMALYNQRAYDEAYIHAKKAAKLNDYESKAVYMMGLINEARGDIAQALIHFQIFLQIDGGRYPQYERASQMRIMRYRQQGRQ